MHSRTNFVFVKKMHTHAISLICFYSFFRYVIADDRVLFQLKDGSLAFDIRDFLVTQNTCLTVSFEQMEFKCKQKKSEL